MTTPANPEQSRRGVLRSMVGGSMLFPGLVSQLLADEATGVIRLVNPAAERMFGYEAGQMIGLHVRDLTERHAVKRLKKQFVATVSHELRTPLTSVRGSLGLLASGAMGEFSPAAIRLVEIAERNVVRLVGLMSRSRFLVGHPADDGRLIFVKEGEAFNVSTFDGAVISAFDSTVSISQAPLPIWILPFVPRPKGNSRWAWAPAMPGTPARRAVRWPGTATRWAWARGGSPAPLSCGLPAPPLGFSIFQYIRSM